MKFINGAKSIHKEECAGTGTVSATLKRRGCCHSIVLYLTFMLLVVCGFPIMPVGALQPTTISISVTPSSVNLGGTVAVSGVISPEVPGVQVSLAYTRPDGTGFTRTLTTSLLSTFADAYVPDMSGNWTVMASWSGNGQYGGATSPIASFMTVGLPPGASGITCVTDFSSVILGQSINVSGRLVPARQTTITLELSTGGFWSQLANVTSEPDGAYRYLWTPKSTGSYLLRARWPGDSSHTGATSPQVSVVVHTQHAPDFSISAAPSSQEIKPGETGTFTVTITSLYGFNSSVTLAISGLPPNAVGSFNPPSVSGNESSILTISTTGELAQGTSAARVSGTAGEQVRSVTISLEVATSESTSTTSESTPSRTVPFIGVPETLLAILVGLFLVSRMRHSRNRESRPNAETPVGLCQLSYDVDQRTVKRVIRR